MENKKLGFTLVELIIVLAIIAALIGILITIIKPQQIFTRLRDTQRSADLNNLSRAIDIYLGEFANSPGAIRLARPDNNSCLGGTASPTIYYSVTTSGNIAGGYQATGSVSTAVDGTGWLPVPLASSSMVQLSQLPLDPRNSLADRFYYTYGCRTDFTYELNARLETMTDLAQNDGGNAPTLLEVGPDKTILPNATTGFYQ